MPAMRPAVLVLLVAMLVVPFGLVPAAHAGGDTKGGFVVTCHYSHTAQDDPIVFPGQPGAAHSHDFFGNQSTDASSTYQSMVVGQSSCSVPQDTAGYWVPSPYVDGSAIHPTGRVGDLRVYYRNAGAKSVQSIPASLELIGGGKAATPPPPRCEGCWD